MQTVHASSPSTHPKVLLIDHCSNRMPFCHSLSVAELQAGLSAPRLSSYQALVGAGTPESTVGAYMWSLELNAALTPLLSMVEVLLRNNVHSAATATFGKLDWHQDVLKYQSGQEFQRKVTATPALAQRFYHPSCPPHHRRTAWSAGVRRRLERYLSPAEAKHQDILKRLTKEGKPNTPDQVVAHAMFGYWLDLLAPGFDSPAALSLWPQCTAAVFPNDATMTRAKAAAYLNNIKKLRNRVSHHEPVWSLAIPKTPAGVSTYMTQQVNQMLELAGAMNQHAVTLLHNGGALARLQWLLMPKTIAEYAGQAQPSPVDLRRLTRKVRQLATGAARRRTAAAAANPGRAINVTHAGTTILTVMPHA